MKKKRKFNIDVSSGETSKKSVDVNDASQRRKKTSLSPSSEDSFLALNFRYSFLKSRIFYLKGHLHVRFHSPFLKGHSHVRFYSPFIKGPFTRAISQSILIGNLHTRFHNPFLKGHSHVRFHSPFLQSIVRNVFYLE
jgi:hypothetical protein